MLLVNNKTPKMLFFDICSDMLLRLGQVLFPFNAVSWRYFCVEICKVVYIQTIVTSKSLTMHVQFEFEFLFLGN